MERAGKLPKARGEVIMGSDKRLTFKEKDTAEALAENTKDLETMRRRLDIRARCMEMLEVGTFLTYRALNDRYIGCILEVV